MSGVHKKTESGRWTRAVPERLAYDVRPWYVKVWHLLLVWRDTDELMEDGGWWEVR